MANKEIVEQGVTAIELMTTTKYPERFHPHEGWVKWFEDELGQIWCKFHHRKLNSSADLVFPACRVVVVEYQKERK